ncbi:hypothetical protein HF086_002583 [Spodoptera exigua]|uniref:Uncharacterized protein n=1 Tax=Spodoptera exigua TaxID=7107 RepID=A0A922SGM2_SPOEX|nr:hypothetical protein HF086_002583 [Spodoptera exigua]
MRLTVQMKAAAILLIFHITATRTAKNNAPSVHEIINEQSRIDEKRPLSYGNPLAGNSQQNAKLHAQHQQAMFNAERIRQHRAQIQRWNAQPQQGDSYMRAYHESQENHQLALEQMQATQREKKPKQRQERTHLRSRPSLDPVKLTRADAVDKNRNHRSYGSVYYNNVQPKHKVNTSPGTTYDQGVTIKPNGNIGLNNLEKEQTGLYTEVSPSKTQYVYPKLYHQMHSYQSADDISALNNLLSKTPQEQVSELNTLTHTNQEYGKDNLETPIDLYFYLNNPNGLNIVHDNKIKYNVDNAYAGPYATEYVNYNDHKPITEEVDDIEEDKVPNLKFQPIPQTQTVMPHVFEDPTTTKSNYYKIEVEQTISGNLHGNGVEFPVQHKPSYGAVKYEKPLNIYHQEASTEGIKYLQAQQAGVQHLSQDGTGVSAYGDDDVSIKRRVKRQLDTTLFILGNETLVQNGNHSKANVTSLSLNNTDFKGNVSNSYDNIAFGSDINETLPSSEEWKRYRTFNNFDSTFQFAGEAKDYDYYEDENKDYAYESDYDSDYEFNPPDLDYPAPNSFKRPVTFTRPPRPRNFANHNLDAQNSFSNRFSNFKHPNYNDFHSDPSDDYAPSDSYGPPGYGQPYGPPKSQFRPHKPQYPEVSSLIDSLEPVYMLTESQLKDIVNQRHVNVQHLDVFQYPSLTKPKHRYPRRNKKHRQNRRPNKLGKFRKLHKLIQY